MDKIQLLRQRRSKVLAAGKEIRKTIAALTDAESFVELSGFSFSKNDFYDGFSGETVSKDGVFDGAVEGEGVVTGFATIGGYPVYIAAQNFEVLHGGVSAANCAKLMKCLSLAEKNSTPVVYVLHSLGVQIGEGVTVLEGLASLIAKAAKLHGIVPQFAVVNGEVYGQSSLLAACADFTFFMKDGVLAADSPLVLSAKSGQNLAKEEVGGAAALGKTNLVSFEAATYADVRASIEKILGLIPAYGALVEETGADLNATFPALNKKCDADALIKCVFDAGSCVEFGKACSPAVRSLLGRVGGISVAAVVFDGGEEGVSLDAAAVAKVTSLVEFASYYDIPFVTFVDTQGVRSDLETNNSLVLKNIFKLAESYDLHENARIAVIFKRAVGLGYTLFAAKSMGFDYVYAFADARVALFDDAKGAALEFSAEANTNAAKCAAKYADETADPVNAARNGYVDNIIEPALVKQYLVASLQMLLK